MYALFWKRWLDFAGRSRRREYWVPTVWNAVIVFVLSFCDGLVFGSNYPIISSVFSLVILVPGLAITIRRLHDTGRSGWWIFISLVPVIGVLVLLVLLVLDSEPKTNEYGPSSKYNDDSSVTERMSPPPYNR